MSCQAYLEIQVDERDDMLCQQVAAVLAKYQSRYGVSLIALNLKDNFGQFVSLHSGAKGRKSI